MPYAFSFSNPRRVQQILLLKVVYVFYVHYHSKRETKTFVTNQIYILEPLPCQYKSVSRFVFFHEKPVHLLAFHKLSGCCNGAADPFKNNLTTVYVQVCIYVLVCRK